MGSQLNPIPFQYYCCKKDESEEDEEEPDFAVHSHIPPLHCNRNVVLTNGPSLYSSSPFSKKATPSRSGSFVTGARRRCSPAAARSRPGPLLPRGRAHSLGGSRPPRRAPRWRVPRLVAPLHRAAGELLRCEVTA